MQLTRHPRSVEIWAQSSSLPNISIVRSEQRKFLNTGTLSALLLQEKKPSRSTALEILIGTAVLVQAHAVVA